MITPSPTANAQDVTAEVELLREQLAVAVAAMEKAKAVWFGNNQTPTQCGYLMANHIRSGLWKIARLAGAPVSDEVSA